MGRSSWKESKLREHAEPRDFEPGLRVLDEMNRKEQGVQHTVRCGPAFNNASRSQSAARLVQALSHLSSQHQSGTGQGPDRVPTHHAWRFSIHVSCAATRLVGVSPFFFFSSSFFLSSMFSIFIFFFFLGRCSALCSSYLERVVQYLKTPAHNLRLDKHSYLSYYYLTCICYPEGRALINHLWLVHVRITFGNQICKESKPGGKLQRPTSIQSLMNRIYPS